ncbi:MAG: hypothetical protein ACI89J_000192 [Hyphomicrobiaceae bacterium]|jgi:hypothetical protein
MKKRKGIARAVDVLTIEELETLPTKVLIARLKRLRFCEETAETSDLSSMEIASVSHKILFKNTLIWREAYAQLKRILDLREDV